MSGASSTPPTGHALPAWLDPLLEPAELRAGDAYAIDELGTPGIMLMRRAGSVLANAAAAALPRGRIAVVCGPGNNGGDGLVAADVLHERGRDVVVLTTRDPAGYRGDAALARDACGAPLMPFAPALLDDCTGAIDALLGTGASGPPHGAELQAIDALTASGLPVVACDVPSGIDASSGAVAGSAVRAIRTVTFHRPSPGHVVRPAKGYVGALEVVDIGVPDGGPIWPQTGALLDAVLAELPARGGDAHKYAAGAVVVIAGGEQYPGAGVLAVRGAQRAGAGYVTAVVSAAAAALVHAAAPEVIVRPWPVTVADVAAAISRQLGARADAVVAGPGLGADPHAEPLIHAALASALPLVLDADGLAPFAGRPEALRRAAPLIITPHAGELGRLLGRSSAEIGAARLASAREAAARSGAVVVLKGDDTIIAQPGGWTAINTLAAPALATAGTGDVLAGAIGALLAAGAEPWLAACAAVHLHARAGRLAASRLGSVDGVVAFDVAELLPAARRTT